MMSEGEEKGNPGEDEDGPVRGEIRSSCTRARPPGEQATKTKKQEFDDQYTKEISYVKRGRSVPGEREKAERSEGCCR